MWGDDGLLREIFPPHIVEKLRKREKVEPEFFPAVSILFADVVGWTELCDKCQPLQAHHLLHDLYTVLDYCLSFFPSLYKVETIGDCLVVLAGAPIHMQCSIQDLVCFGLLIAHAVPRAVKHPISRGPIHIRVGIHSGDVVGGVMGTAMPRFTLTGDAVNVAARMQSLSRAGAVLVSSASAVVIDAKCAGPAEPCAEKSFSAVDIQRGLDSGTLIEFTKFTLVSAGLLEVKGKGQMGAFFVENSCFSPHPAPTEPLRKASSYNSLLASLESAPLPRRRSHDDITELDPARPVVALLGAPTGAANETAEARVKLFMDRADVRAFILTPGPLEDVWEEAEADSTWAEVDGSGRVAAAVPGGGSRAPSPAIKAAPSPLPSKPTPSSPHGLNLSGLRIMIVEDSVSQRKMICQQLRVLDPSWTVRSASNASELLQELRRDRDLDLLLVDMNLGDVNGILAGGILVDNVRRKFPASMRGVATVLMSRDSTEREINAIDSCGAVDAFWAKPLPSKEVLLTYLSNAIAVVRAQGDRKRPPLTTSSTNSSGLTDSEDASSLDSGSLGSSGSGPDYSVPWMQAVSPMLSATALSSGYHSESAVLRIKKAELTMPEGLRVLVIKDSDAQRKLMAKLLVQCSPSMSVLCLPDAASTVKHLRANSASSLFYVAFVGLNVGEEGTDGTGLVELLRSAFCADSQVLIGVTSESSLDKSFLAAGADAVWGVPLPPPVIVRHRLSVLLKARRLLGSSRPLSSSPSPSPSPSLKKEPRGSSCGC